MLEEVLDPLDSSLILSIFYKGNLVTFKYKVVPRFGEQAPSVGTPKPQHKIFGAQTRE